MNKSAADMATRIDNARARFVSVLTEQHALSAQDADRVADAYQHLGLIRFGANDGQFHLKSGSLLDPDTVQSAIDNYCSIMAQRAVKFR